MWVPLARLRDRDPGGALRRRRGERPQRAALSGAARERRRAPGFRVGLCSVLAAAHAAGSTVTESATPAGQEARVRPLPEPAVQARRVPRHSAVNEDPIPVMGSVTACRSLVPHPSPVGPAQRSLAESPARGRRPGP